VSCSGVGGAGATAQLEHVLAVANHDDDAFAVTTSGWGASVTATKSMAAQQPACSTARHD